MMFVGKEGAVCGARAAVGAANDGRPGDWLAVAIIVCGVLEWRSTIGRRAS